MSSCLIVLNLLISFFKLNVNAECCLRSSAWECKSVLLMIWIMTYNWSDSKEENGWTGVIFHGIFRLNNLHLSIIFQPHLIWFTFKEHFAAEKKHHLLVCTILEKFSTTINIIQNMILFTFRCFPYSNI